ncbi:type II toxin-antitoxin system VapC family toxin [Kaistia sp. UC242_56]|uniref:type II toxin-antitoxin system VapC family toxin n=1 Tax=Kaistia sp. UC242_56 TaxID=3374625 RepID=UPI003383B682|nr:type II toxin-antitoxin system VapC family toxin [Kaistia sp.]
MTQLLLDTCAMIWVAGNAELAEPAIAALDDAEDEAMPVFLSPISAWEIGLLVARNRLTLPTRPKAWLDRLLKAPNLRLAQLPPGVLIDSAFLPGTPPRDPADRIIIATAREYDLTIMTRDRLILDYAEAGHVRAIAC